LFLNRYGHTGPVYVVEFQGQRSEKAWYNLLAKIGPYGEAHPQRDVIGTGIFLQDQQVPLAPAERDILAQVLEFWFSERFRGRAAKEIWAMLPCATSPLELVRQHKLDPMTPNRSHNPWREGNRRARCRKTVHWV